MLKHLGRSVTILVLIFNACIATAKESSTSGLLVEEVLAETSSPRQYDWQNSPLIVDARYFQIDEANSFESYGYGLGLAHPLGDRWLGRLDFRRVETHATNSSRLVSLTPFDQAAQPSRYEFLAGVGYALLEGRSSTPLSPRMTDINHALLAIAGIQYNLFDADSPETMLPGMRSVKYQLVTETGLRFQVFLPQALGLALEWSYSFPVSDADPDLKGWQSYGGSLLWSFGL